MPLELPRVELAGIAPEIALCLGAIVVLIVDAFLHDEEERLHLPLLSSVALGLAIGFAIAAWGTAADDGGELQIAGMVAVDGFSAFVKVVLGLFGVLTVWLGREYLRREGIEEPEFYALILFSLAGMMLMASAADLIMIFLGLETFSIALYVLVGFRRGSLTSQESALKYFLLGAFSSAFFLLGIAITYGAVGATNLYGSGGPGGTEGIVHFVRTTPAADLGVLVLGSALLVVGLGFKVAAVPFHMWTPDAYQGAPTPVTGFMAAASKVAGFAALIRLLDASLFSLRWDWQPLLAAIAVATMVVGSVLAVVQEDVKRMLAYSSIAHAGFLLVGVIAANDRGVSGTLFYLATYGLTVVGAFAVVTALGGKGERRVRLASYKGLFYEQPLLAAALTLFLLSLAGVPVTSGFVGKLVVFGAAIEAGHAWLVVVGVLASAVAAFFYLRVTVVMYMQEPDSPAPAPAFGPTTGGVVALAAAATVFFGLVWGPLIDLTDRATLFFTTTF